MLVAVDDTGARHVASDALRDSSLHCPTCGAGVVVRCPQVRVPHFAHRPGARCQLRTAERRGARELARRRATALRAAHDIEAGGQQALLAVTDVLAEPDEPAAGPL